MTVTAQTNTTLEEIAKALLAHDGFCVCGHVNPDGDCIGSTLALVWALRSIGKRPVALIADGTHIDAGMRSLPGSDDLVAAPSYNGPCEVFVVVDAPCQNRIGESAAAIKSRAKLSITLDHHAYPERVSDLSYTDPDSASTTMIIWKLAHHLGVDFNSADGRHVAHCAYAGLLTDTGSFMYQNTNEDALRCGMEMLSCGIDGPAISESLFQQRSLASVRIDSIVAERMKLLGNGKAVLSWVSLEDMENLKADKADTEHAINIIRCIAGVEVACILKERDGQVRGSLRGKGDVDVRALAGEFGGGGHRAAAGFSLACSLPEAIQTMTSRLERFTSEL